MEKQTPQKNKPKQTASPHPFFQKKGKESFFSKSSDFVPPFFDKPKLNSNSSNQVIQRKFKGTDGKEVKLKKKSSQVEIKSKNASADLKELVRLINSSGSLTAVKQILKTSKNNSGNYSG